MIAASPTGTRPGSQVDLGADGFSLFSFDGESIADAALDALVAAVGQDWLTLAWSCAWDGGRPGYDGITVLANGVEVTPDGSYPFDSPHAPGRSSVYISTHPRVITDSPKFAEDVAARAGLRLRRLRGLRGSR